MVNCSIHGELLPVVTYHGRGAIMTERLGFHGTFLGFLNHQVGYCRKLGDGPDIPAGYGHVISIFFKKNYLPRIVPFHQSHPPYSNEEHRICLLIQLRFLMLPPVPLLSLPRIQNSGSRRVSKIYCVFS